MRICTTGGGGLHARLMLKVHPQYRHCRPLKLYFVNQLSSGRFGETLLIEGKWRVENARVEPVTAASSRLSLTSEGQGNSSAFSGVRGFWGRTTCSRGDACGEQDKNLYVLLQDVKASATRLLLLFGSASIYQEGAQPQSICSTRYLHHIETC